MYNIEFSDLNTLNMLNSLNLWSTFIPVDVCGVNDCKLLVYISFYVQDLRLFAVSRTTFNTN